jgi:hypothetical protein
MDIDNSIEGLIEQEVFLDSLFDTFSSMTLNEVRSYFTENPNEVKVMIDRIRHAEQQSNQFKNLYTNRQLLDRKRRIEFLKEFMNVYSEY